jgi:hypothetical protein
MLPSCRHSASSNMRSVDHHSLSCILILLQQVWSFLMVYISNMWNVVVSSCTHTYVSSGLLYTTQLRLWRHNILVGGVVASEVPCLLGLVGKISFLWLALVAFVNTSFPHWRHRWWELSQIPQALCLFSTVSTLRCFGGLAVCFAVVLSSCRSTMSVMFFWV